MRRRAASRSGGEREEQVGGVMQLSLQYAPVKAPRQKRLTQKDRVLAMFRDAYGRDIWLTNIDFLDCYPRLPNFRSRFTEIDEELKDEGLHISDAVYVRTGVYKYRLEALCR